MSVAVATTTIAHVALGPAPEAGKEHRKHAVRLWKLENPQEGQVQSPGRGRFLLGGKG